MHEPQGQGDLDSRPVSGTYRRSCPDDAHMSLQALVAME